MLATSEPGPYDLSRPVATLCRHDLERRPTQANGDRDATDLTVVTLQAA